MRLDKFTTKFQEALGDAQSLALGNDNAYIEPVHLLVAMLRQDDGPRALLERAGAAEVGSITGLYTVLVEGDDFNEPVTDNLRAILDGGEWYRLATALTLHADIVHLLSNCLLGAVVIHYLLGLTGNGIGLYVTVNDEDGEFQVFVHAHSLRTIHLQGRSVRSKGTAH